MNNEVLNKICSIDKEKVLEQFLEDNFNEFKAGQWLEGIHTPLSDEWVCENRKMAGIERDAEEELLQMAKNVREDDTLKFLFFHCARLLCDLNKRYSGVVADWPDFSPLIPGNKGSMFLLLLGFHAIDKIIAVHKTMNIPEDITRATCADVGSRVLISKEFKNGEIGISLTCLNWLCSSFIAGRLFQIGRMQFQLIQMSQPFRVYRRKSQPEYKIIAESGLRIAPDGLPDCPGYKLNHEAWKTIIKIDGDNITANHIDDETGIVKRIPETFSLSEWELVINIDSLVMNIHIPRGDRISTDIWFGSIARAFDFFEKTYQPSVNLKACVCFSWMFEPRLRTFLPEKSGLMSLQNAVHLFPLLTSSTTTGLYFVFGADEIDLNSAPIDTSLRRGMIEHLKKGGVFTGGSMIFFRDELNLISGS